MADFEAVLTVKLRVEGITEDEVYGEEDLRAAIKKEVEDDIESYALSRVEVIAVTDLIDFTLDEPDEDEKREEGD